jgi:hypothetical protein
MAHTPAPWLRESQINSEGSDWIIVTKDYEEIVDLRLGDGHVVSEDAQEANAHLIAAAPEMLVVLKRVIDMANCAMEYEGVDDAHTLKRAMERISKAKRECERAVEKATMEEKNGKERSLD